LWAVVYAADPSGNFPASSDYWRNNVGFVGTEALIAVAPAP
jgi:hypothetical protein